MRDQSSGRGVVKTLFVTEQLGEDLWRGERGQACPDGGRTYPVVRTRADEIRVRSGIIFAFCCSIVVVGSGGVVLS